jgi:hypothetical protein
MPALREKGESPPNTRRGRPTLNDDPSMCATLYTVSGVGELYQRRQAINTFVKSLHCADHHPVRIGNEREPLIAASPVMTKSWGPSWGKQLHGERPRETAETLHTMIPLFVLPFILFLVLASSTSGDQHFCEIVTLCRPPNHQDWGRARTVGNRFARDDKELGPQLGETVIRRAAS